MIVTLLGVPVMTIMLMLQSGVVSRLNLLHGSADVVLLVVIAWCLQTRVKTGIEWSIIGGLLVSIVTATPFYTPFFAYVATAIFARWIVYRFWQSPLMTMLITTVIGTLLYHFLSYAFLWVNGTALPLLGSLTQVTLPSIFLNLLFALPVFTVITDLANWIYPEEVV
jgi:rod shape-determining protein MreD